MGWSLKRNKYAIGIDAGTNTGLAVWDVSAKKFVDIRTAKIHEAMDLVRGYKDHDVVVRVEDARKRTWFGNAGRERLKGVGSVNRDCSIWEDYLKDIGVQYEMVAPKNIKTKMTKEQFTRLTKYTGLTSEHSRDAAMIVFGI